MRSAAFVNGVELAVSQLEGWQMKCFETDGTDSSLKQLKEKIVQENFCGILTNMDQGSLMVNENNIPVLTTSGSLQAISMMADENDELRALLSYAVETNKSSVVMILPMQASGLAACEEWINTYPDSRVLHYEDELDSITMDSIVEHKVDCMLIWGNAAQSARLISRLRHAGYTGAILGPSFLAGYEALDINAGQASGVCFAAQYLDPRYNAAILTFQQQQFLQQYTDCFAEAPLFAESYYGADQAYILNKMLTDYSNGNMISKPREVQGVLQIYDYGRNQATGVIDLPIYTIQSGYIVEAR